MELVGDAVLLDLDGTLIDSAPAIARSWLNWAGTYGVDPARLAEAHGRPTAEIVRSLVPPDRFREALTYIDELEVADVSDIRPLPGALDLLAALPDDRWAIVTSCGSALAAARMTAAGIPDPPVLVTADDITSGKPDPEPYLTAAGKLGVEPARCIVVEDARSGIASARAAGMAVVGVATTHPGEPLDVDLLVDTPATLAVRGSGPVAVGVVG